MKIGDRFGRLVVIGLIADTNPKGGKPLQSRAWVRCDCGTEKTIRRWLLKNGITQSCGCLRSEHGRILARRFPINKGPVHGHAGRNGKGDSPTYRSWLKMKARCLNSKNRSFSYYGGRGIRVCERWLSFKNFLEDMGERPTGKSIDRIDNDGNYEP